MSEELQPIEESQDRLPKCSPAEKETRINEVVDLMCKFHTYGEICRFLQDKYGLSRKGSEIYLKEGKEILMKTIPEPKEIIGKHIKAYERIIKRNEETDPRTSMIGMVNIEKLLKLHNPDVQVNQQFNTLNLEGVDIQSIMEAINALKEKKD